MIRVLIWMKTEKIIIQEIYLSWYKNIAKYVSNRIEIQNADQ